MIPYALYNSKISFEPLQYKPYFQFFENVDKNLYIADEVGVGKTIEAGIIISELIFGDRDNDWVRASLDNLENPRILIIAPTSLCAQWKEELEEKFMLFASNCYADKNGFDGNSNIVIYGQSWQQLKLLEDMDVHYDLLIVDEAHNFRNEYIDDIFKGERKESRKYRSLEKITARAKRKILLSATPIFNNEEDWENERNLLDNNFTITSSTKAIAKCLDFQPRIESVLVDLNDVDLELYNKIDCLGGINNLTKSAVYLHEGCSSMPCLAATLTGSAEAYIKSLFQDSEIDRDLLKEIIIAIKEHDDSKIDYLSQNVYGAKTINKIYQFKKELEAFGNEYKKKSKNKKDSKLIALDEIISSKLTLENGYEMSKRHIVVFAHYIVTCEYIYGYLKESTKFKVFIATGENTKEEIDQRIEEFNQTCVDDVEDSIIVCSDVCREGKNMQKCQVLINYDLPFSPSIMQQRIGRIDRNGQTHTPLIFNIICNVENDIHTYYEIIFEKVKIINGQTGICNIDVLKETNDAVRKSVITKWVDEARKHYKESEKSLSAVQKAYIAYLNKNGLDNENVQNEKEHAKSLTDNEIQQKMEELLFLMPNEEIRKLREMEHIKEKRLIRDKLYPNGLEYSIRENMIRDIGATFQKAINMGLISYNGDSDTYLINIENYYDVFCDVIRDNQYYRFFRALENDSNDSTEEYYCEADIAFVSSIYKEIGENSTGKTVGELEKLMELSYDEMFIPLTPLVNIFNAITELEGIG